MCSVYAKYVAAIYWSITTLTTTGYGDFHPYNTGEFIFCAVYMLTTMAITSYVLGNMTAIIVKLSSRVQDYVSIKFLSLSLVLVSSFSGFDFV